MILIAPSIFYLGYQRYNNNFNHYSFAAINKWTLGYNKIGKERIDLALNLQKCEDFIFIPTIMLKNLNLWTDFFTLSIAGKSGFTGHPVLNNLNIKYLKEVENRKSLLDELYLNLNQKKIISKKILENLREYNVVILIDKRFEDQFPSYIKLYKVSETERLFSIMENKKEFKFEKNCIKKIF